MCKRLPRGKAPGDDGLPYEFYVAFWAKLEPRLLAVLNAAFHCTSPAPLPRSMRSGRITLLYKGKGADRTLPSSYFFFFFLQGRSCLTKQHVAARQVMQNLGDGASP